MSRKYQAEDFRSDTKPRITRGARWFGDRVYVFRCKSNTSTGYGTTPTDAYNAWARNFGRRMAFYESRENYARAWLEEVQAVERERLRELRRKHAGTKPSAEVFSIVNDGKK